MMQAFSNIHKIELGLPPFEVYRRLQPHFRKSFMLESAVGERRVVAYSILGFRPRFSISCSHGQMKGGEGLDHLRENPPAFIREVTQRYQIKDQLFPFMSGLVGYFSFEFSRYLEPSLQLPSGSAFPDCELGFYDEYLIYDHSSFQAYHVALGEESLLPDLLHSLPRPRQLELKASQPRAVDQGDEFQEKVLEIKKRIVEGETYQTVLSRKLESHFQGNLLSLYATLRRLNPSPYMFFLDFGDRQVLGSSPETLVTVREREATTFPIAGTRPLGSDPRETRRLQEEMLSDEKERAEHSMLVDLARNDLGHVCESGSVHVEDYMRVEKFYRVQHIVSKVQGTLAEGNSPLDALFSAFPAGTVSGAPKPRSMEIIGELEGRARGPYAGGVGYISLNGNLDSAITIRSAFASGDRLFLQAGAGIVADSDPEREYLETENKLESLTKALALATGGSES